MNRTAELGEITQNHLDEALIALDLAQNRPIEGISQAHQAIETARAVIRLLEAGGKEVRVVNDRLNDTKATLTPMRDANIARPIPPPLNPSTRATISNARSVVEGAKKELEVLTEPMVLSQEQLVVQSGLSYRQARRRFLLALPDGDEEPYDDVLLERCAKATRRLYVQLDVLLKGAHTKRSTKFGKLGDLFDQHHRARLLGVNEGKQIERLETEITKLSLEMFNRKPSAYRDWLTEKLTLDA